MPGTTSKPIRVAAPETPWPTGIARFLRTLRSELAAAGRQFDKNNLSSDLQGLISIVRSVRRRILANSFLQAWAHWWNWILVGLILVAALRAELAGSIVWAMILLALGAATIGTWLWRTRSSSYAVAAKIDAAAGLQDRLSTSLWFGDTAHPDGILQSQRADALKRLPSIDTSQLFPVRMPVAARRTLVLAIVAGGLFVYRVNHPAPLTALLDATRHSQLLQSLLAPRKISPKNANSTVADQADPNVQASERRESSQAADLSTDVWRVGEQDKSKPAENTAPLPDGALPGEQSGDPSSFQPPNSTQGGASLAQSLLQALKNMVSDSANQEDAPDAPPEHSQSRQDASPPKNSSQKGLGSPTDQVGQESPRDSQQNGAQNNAGAGGKEPLPLDPVENTPLVVTPVIDRVALNTTKFKDQKRMPVEPETGEAAVSSASVSAQETAVINGTEQENIPERYRSYVQRYFEHVKKGQ